MTLDILRGVKEIAKRDSLSESMCKQYEKLMLQYRHEGCKFGDNLEGFLKWKTTQRLHNK